MYLETSKISQPEDKDIKIWRYLDIPKFLSIIDKSALFFSRAKYFSDQLEGSIPQSKGQINLNKYFGRVSDVMYSDDGSAHEWYSDHYLFRNIAYVCCFHMNPIESVLLWSSYAQDNKGVAIQSTFNRLCNCFHVDGENTENIGVVKYIDYSPESSETIDVLKWATLPLLYKRKNFEHERELRAIIPFPPSVFPKGGELSKEILDNFPKGLSIPVDLDILIEKIYLAPSSPSWKMDLLNSILKKYNVNKEILHSALDQTPII
ncbi:MAG TPA: DUF2971 domain-containing protein [Methanoregula sp.]|nr:DUF2971 domain-containing protein [Methanoregula sp.]